jgi:hypothetical protein
MGFRLDRREVLVAAGASGMAMSFLALPAVLDQQTTGGSVKAELARVTTASDSRVRPTL